MNESVYIHGYRLELTCFACPEQYDVYDPTSTMVGYIRLRHNVLRVHCPDYGGDVVLEMSNMKGDGIFTDEERYPYLVKCIEAIQKHILNKMFDPIKYDECLDFQHIEP